MISFSNNIAVAFLNCVELTQADFLYYYVIGGVGNFYIQLGLRFLCGAVLIVFLIFICDILQGGVLPNGGDRRRHRRGC